MISTMEQLEAVPVDSTITVTEAGQSKTWTRTADGFTYDGALVRPIAFVGAVNAGTVQAGGGGATTIPGPPCPERGQFYGSIASGWIFLGVEPGSNPIQWRTVRTWTGSPSAIYANRASYWGETPEVIAANWRPATEESLRIANEFDPQIAATPAPDLLAPVEPMVSVAALHQFIADRSWYDTDDRHALDEWLAEQGHPRVCEHDVRVHLWGTLPVPVDYEAARSLTNLSYDYDIEGVSEGSLTWDRYVTITKTGTSSGACLCSEVGRDDFDEYIPANGSLDDYETECA